MMRRMILALRVFGRSSRNFKTSGLSGLPSCSATLVRNSSRNAFAHFTSRLQNAEANQRLAFKRIGDTDGRGLAHGRMADEHGLDFGGAEPFAGNFDRVVGAAENVPETIFINRSPIAVDPNVGESTPVGLKIAFRIFPETTRHADPRLTDDELADLVRAQTFLLHPRRRQQYPAPVRKKRRA